MAAQIKNVVVIGAGTMGSGIALVVAATGHNVKLVDVNQSILDKSRSECEKNAARLARKIFKDDPDTASAYAADALARIAFTINLEQSVAETDLVIEAVIENMNVKQELFKRIDRIAKEHTIFVSNTSSLSIVEMAAATTRADRFAGLHFFNPVPVMKLIEVIRTNQTSQATINALLAFGDALGKTCITCKDTPGFIVNRLLFMLTSEALKMMERGDATIQDIDTAMKLGLGHPVGPFELMDMIGLDVTLNIMRERNARFPNDPESKPSAVIVKMVEENKLGVKSGEGFYSYK